jgi:hypothetical protein
MGRGSFILGIYRADENHSEWKNLGGSPTERHISL